MGIISSSGGLQAFCIFAFLLVAIFLMVHVLMHKLREKLPRKRWLMAQTLLFVFYIVAEAWVIGYLSLTFSKSGIVQLLSYMMSAMVWCTALYLSTGKPNNELSENLLPPEAYDEDDLQAGTQATKESYFQLSDLPHLSLKLSTALAFLLGTLTACLLLSVLTYNFRDWVLLAISLLASSLFGLFLLHKAHLVLTGKSASLQLGKDDYIIGYIKLIYLDSAFFLLILLIVMLCMIENFTEQ